MFSKMAVLTPRVSRSQRGRPLLRVAAFTASLGYCVQAQGQDLAQLAEMSLDELLQVSTTTASGGQAEQRATAAGNVTVVGRDEIMRNGWRSVAQVLSNVPGLYLSDDGSITSVAVRGVSTGLHGGSRLVKIMINGTPVNFRPSLRAFLGPEYLPIEAVERIEVVKGPLSALYGANAFLATVNVVTRVPTAGTAAETAVRYITTNGNPGHGQSLLATHGSDVVSLTVAVSSSQLDRSGLSIERTFAAQDPALPRYSPLFDDASQGDQANPRSGYLQIVIPTQDAGTFSLDGGVQRLDQNAEFRLNSVLTHQSRESLVNHWLSARHDYPWSKAVSTRTTFGYSEGHPTRDDQLRLTVNRSRTFTRNFDYNAFSLGSALSYEPSDRFSVKLGVDYEADREGVLFYTATLTQAEGNRPAGDQIELIPPDTPRRQLLTDLGVYAQVRGRPFAALPKLQLTANGRVDRVASGSFEPPLQLSARAGVVYEWSEKLIAKVVAGRAFQTPSGVLLFAQPGFGVANNVIGNLTAESTVPSLEPQTLESIEGTLYLVGGELAVLELSAFYQRLSDRIEFRNAGTDYVARNSGTATFGGFEALLQVDLGPVTPFASLASVRAIEDSQNDQTSLPGYPSRLLTAGARIEFSRPRLYLNTRLRHVGPRDATEPNVLLNSGAAYSLRSFTTGDVSLSTAGLPLLGREPRTYLTLTMLNAFDARYSEAGFGGFDTPAQGRSSLFELRQTF